MRIIGVTFAALEFVPVHIVENIFHMIIEMV